MSLYDKVEDLLHSLRIKKYQRDVFFRIIDELPGLLPVEILKGSYKGTVFAITGIHVLDDYGHSKYDIKLVKRVPTKYYGDGFYKVAGDILLVCLDEAQVNRVTLRNEVINDDTDDPDYIEESTSQRAVSKKGSAIPKA